MAIQRRVQTNPNKNKGSNTPGSGLPKSKKIVTKKPQVNKDVVASKRSRDQKTRNYKEDSYTPTPEPETERAPVPKRFPPRVQARRSYKEDSYTAGLPAPKKFKKGSISPHSSTAPTRKSPTKRPQRNYKEESNTPTPELEDIAPVRKSGESVLGEVEVALRPVEDEPAAQRFLNRSPERHHRRRSASRTKSRSGAVMTKKSKRGRIIRYSKISEKQIEKEIKNFRPASPKRPTQGNAQKRVSVAQQRQAGGASETEDRRSRPRSVAQRKGRSSVYPFRDLSIDARAVRIPRRKSAQRTSPQQRHSPARRSTVPSASSLKRVSMAAQIGINRFGIDQDEELDDVDDEDYVDRIGKTYQRTPYPARKRKRRISISSDETGNEEDKDENYEEREEEEEEVEDDEEQREDLSPSKNSTRGKRAQKTSSVEKRETGLSGKGKKRGRPNKRRSAVANKGRKAARTGPAIAVVSGKTLSVALDKVDTSPEFKRYFSARPKYSASAKKALEPKSTSSLKKVIEQPTKRVGRPPKKGGGNMATAVLKKAAGRPSKGVRVVGVRKQPAFEGKRGGRRAGKK